MEDRESDPLSLDLVRGDLLFRFQRALHLIPAGGGDGIIRRALFFGMLTWLPLAIWALATGHAFSSEAGEPLLRHFSIHARFLVALPCLILGEKLSRSLMRRLLPRFVTMGIVPAESVPAFREIVAATKRLRDSTLPWITVGGLVILWSCFSATGHGFEELNWATDDGQLRFGGWWYLAVSRPLFQVLLLGWLWRIVLMTVMFRRISKLDLKPIATHPDQLGGLGFIEGFPRIFAPFAFGISAVLCSHWLHQIACHGAHVSGFKMQAAVFGALILLISFAPLLVFAPVLKRVKRLAIGQYSELIARHGRQVHEQWIEGSPPEDRSLLEAPELGPACDINALYDSVRTMKTLPIGKKSLMSVAIPVAIPMILASTMEIPIVDLVGKIFKAII